MLVSDVCTVLQVLGTEFGLMLEGVFNERAGQDKDFNQMLVVE